MTRKNQKSVSLYLSDEEKKALDKVRGSLTYREYILRGVVEPRPRGRPSLDAATKDIEDQIRQRQEDKKKSVHDKLLAANRRGLAPDVSLRMLGDESPWTPIKCPNCGHEYETLEKQKSKCPNCMRMNPTPRKPEALGLPSEISEEASEGGEVAVNTEGNLSSDMDFTRFKFGKKSKKLLKELEEERKGNLGKYTLPTWKGKMRVGSERFRDSLNPGVVNEDHSRFKFGKKKKKAR